jgi:hypothetical protein
VTAWQPKQGSREIDRVIAPLGRVRLRTGTRDRRRAESYDRMLDDLPLDVIRLLVAKVITLREVYELRQAGKPLPAADELRPLFPTLEAWLDRPLRPVGPAEQTGRESLVAVLRDLAPSEPTVAVLPRLCRTIYERYRDAGQGAAWNRRKAQALAFLRDVLGKRSLIYGAVQALPVLREVPKYDRHPCTVAEAKAIRLELGPKWGAQWWTLCLTGMEPKEHWTDGWKVLRAGVEIHGQKRPARERVVPFVAALTPPVGKQAGFAEALERAELGVTPLDARRSYQRWLDEIGLPTYRQDAYAGHGPKSMRALYKWGDITAWLAEDGKALRAYLGERALALGKGR